MIPVYGLSGIEGVYDTPTAKAAATTQLESPAQRKARVLVQLASTDPDAYRLASLYMPYVVDIDPEDGGYYFPSLELAGIAANGEERWVAFCKCPHASELGKIKLLQKIGSAIKNAGQAVVNAGKAAANSVANVAKATANTVKATGQLVTGNAKGAAKTIKTAGQQVVSAHVDPVKTAVQDTKTMVKDSIDIFKETIKIAGKVFKVLFIKINPVTVLIRNSWRGLLAINFLGMATRLGVGLMSLENAEKAGYSRETWEKAVKAVAKAKKLYRKMGGDDSKLEKTIKNGATKKALFKKDISPASKVNFVNSDTDDGDTTTLGEPITVATMIAACIGIVTSVWAWVKDIVVTRKQTKEAEAQKKEAEAQQQYNAEHYELDAAGNVIVDQYGQAVPKGTIAADKQAAAAAQLAAEEEVDNKKNIIKYAAIGATIVGTGALLFGTKGGKRRSKRR